MSSFGSPSPFFLAGKKAYEVERSLRFNDGDSANLTRTSSSTSTTFTYSAWIKRTHFSGYQYIFSMGSRGFAFHTNNNTFYLYDGSNLNESTAKFRDPSAWYHIVVQINSGVATSYVNGVLVHNAVGSGFTLTTGTNETRIGSQTSTYYFDGYMAEINLVDGSVVAPSSFAETDAITGQWIPKKYTGSYGTNGFYLNFSDNSGTTATTLGKDSSGNGNNFTPNNFSVAAGTGNDSLEDTPTNNFCTLNSVKKDGQTTLSNGNLQASGSQTSTYNINTQGTFAQSSGKWYYEVEFTSGSGSCAVGWARTTLRSSDNPTTGGGIIYRPTNGDYVDLAANNPTTPPTTSTGTVIQVAIDFDAGKIWFGSGGTYFNSGDPSAASNEAMTFTGGSELLAPVVRTMASTFNFNFGQRAFSYTVPTGYKSLCSANLPDPTILLPNKHFDSVLWTGDGGTRTISGLNFSPDWVWIKNRSNAYHHGLFDAVRGANKVLKSSDTSAEGTFTQQLMSFNSNGFSLGDNGDGGNYVNINGHTYVGWNWNAGDTDGKTYTVTVVDSGGNKFRFDGFAANAVTLDLAEGGTYIFNYPSGHPFRFSTTADGTHGGGSEYTTGVTHNSSTQVTIVVAASAPQLYYYCASHSGMGGAINTNSTLGSSNFDGTIQATAKVNATAGFSIVTYSGNGSSDSTIGHGLGVAPKAVIVKRRNGTDNWQVYWIGTGTERNGYLSLTNAFNTPAQTSIWGTNVPTSTKFYLGTDTATNTSGSTYVGYVFSEVAGYSKFGSYTGNGSSTDGTFVYLGFRPAWVMVKQTNSTGSWYIFDNKRDGYNETEPYLLSNSSNVEATDLGWDILSNGFKNRNNYAQTNASGSTYIYLAFAESPFKYARAR